MKVLGFLSESCLPILSISRVNFQEQDRRKLWSFTFLSNPSCWRKLNFVTSSLLSELLLRQSYRKSDFIHSPELAASCATTSSRITPASLSAARCSPKGHQPRRGAGGPPPPPQPQRSQHQLQNRPRLLLTSLCSCWEKDFSCWSALH